MKRTAVISSTIMSVGYDTAKSVLQICFTSGEIYNYSSVPIDIYKGLLTAESKGGYFNEMIKGRYKYRKV